MGTRFVGRRWGAALGAAGVAIAGIPSAAPTAEATTVVLARAPYVTDLTTTSAYINWGIAGSGTIGSVMVQPAPGSGGCPTSIAWSSSQQITGRTTVPLIDVPANTTTTPWDYMVNATSEWQESVPISGLQGGTQYCYAVYDTHSGTPSQLATTGSFTTLDPSGSASSLTFDVIGDTGETQSSPGVDYPNFVNPGQQALYSEIGSSGAKFLLMVGDVAYSGGTQNSYGDLSQSGDDISDIFGPTSFPLANGIPTFVADGNHGQNSNLLKIWPQPQTALASSGAYDFNAAAANGDGITGSYPEDWYAFSDGNVRIYVLDAAWSDSSAGTTANALCANNTTYWSSASDCMGYQADYDQHWTQSSTEYQWLQSDLAAHAGGVKMAVFHYPLRSDNGTQASDPYLLNDPTLNPSGYTSSLESLLAANGVKVAFNGHAHTYQRFVPSAPGTVASFVTGGGGGILEPVGTAGNPTCKALLASGSVYAIGWSPTSNQGSACGTPNTPTSSMQVFSYLQVNVTGGLVTVTAYNAQNVAFDQNQFTYSVNSNPPTAPTNLHGTAVSDSGIDLTWSSSTGGSGVAGYKVLRNGTVVGTTFGATSFADTGLSPSTTYTYKVEAFDSGGNLSAPSSAVQVMTLADTQPPSSPQGLRATVVSSGEVDLAWSPSTDNVGVAGYKVLRNGAPVGTTSNTSYRDTGLSANTTYTYSVEAFDAAGNFSAPSSPVKATTPATSPPIGQQGSPCPTGVTHSASGEPWAVAAMTTTISGQPCPGYWVVTRTGGVTSIGAAPWLGDMS
ncbi:MAG TPA: fibronectin type III domain-containing protein, partial [Acidimicrobiales bacterium]|nr:fibronectin type III domain-containing protein [Acidimicrobiales bacterium]